MDMPLDSNQLDTDVVLNKITYIFSIRDNFNIVKLLSISDYELRQRNDLIENFGNAILTSWGLYISKNCN